MTAIDIVLAAAALMLAVWIGRGLASYFANRRRQRWRARRRGARRVPSPSPAGSFPQKKPAWVKQAVLALHERSGLSHRKLADSFNHLYFATTGQSVGRTWVRDLLMRQAHEALHRQRALKHRIPLPVPVNQVWGIDTTCVRDGLGVQHEVLGIVDHGSRLSIALRPLLRFNTWTLLGCLFLAIGEFGKPTAIKTDNHPVFRAKWVKRVLRGCGVAMRFSAPGKPWQNGRIERFFGTLKAGLRDYAIRDGQHLWSSLAVFRVWYNEVRPHQHLGGCTPSHVWRGIDPYRQRPKTAIKFAAWDSRLRGWVLRH